MKIVILPAARDDLAEGHDFYERQGEGPGTYFLESLFSDVDSLRLYAGIHRRIFWLPAAPVETVSVGGVLRGSRPGNPREGHSRLPAKPGLDRASAAAVRPFFP